MCPHFLRVISLTSLSFQTLTDYQARLQEHQNIETTLRNQITMYNNKYEEFEKSLTRSNKMFGGFKEEMEGVSIWI